MKPSTGITIEKLRRAQAMMKSETQRAAEPYPGAIYEKAYLTQFASRCLDEASTMPATAIDQKRKAD